MFEKKFCPRQRSCPGQVACSRKKSCFQRKFCPRQRSCPGRVACSKTNHILRKSSAPGSEATRDKWLLQKDRFLRKSSAPGSEAARDKRLVQKEKSFLRKQFCPRQRSCPGQVVSSKTKMFEKVLPQAAKLLGTSGLSQKKSYF